MTTVDEARIESGRSNILKGIPLLLITTFGWGANWPIMKIVLLYLPPLTNSLRSWSVVLQFSIPAPIFVWMGYPTRTSLRQPCSRGEWTSLTKRN